MITLLNFVRNTINLNYFTKRSLPFSRIRFVSLRVRGLSVCRSRSPASIIGLAPFRPEPASQPMGVHSLVQPPGGEKCAEIAAIKGRSPTYASSPHPHHPRPVLRVPLCSALTTPGATRSGYGDADRPHECINHRRHHRHRGNYA